MRVQPSESLTVLPKVHSNSVPAPSVGARTSTESAIARITGRPTPKPGLSSRGCMPSP